MWWFYYLHFDGLVQEFSNSSALSMKLLQSCTKPSICFEIIVERVKIYVCCIADFFQILLSIDI